jgi:hypothetical protein
MQQQIGVDDLGSLSNVQRRTNFLEIGSVNDQKAAGLSLFSLNFVD